MVGYGKYISVLMLAAFLFPQAANAMHHFLVPHAGYFPSSASFNFDASGIYEYHECDYHFTGTDSALTVADTAEKNILPKIHLQQITWYDNNYILQLCHHYYLRGPPSIAFYP